MNYKILVVDDESEIANNIARKVKPKENIEQAKNKNNFELK